MRVRKRGSFRFGMISLVLMGGVFLYFDHRESTIRENGLVVTGVVQKKTSEWTRSGKSRKKRYYLHVAYQTHRGDGMFERFSVNRTESQMFQTGSEIEIRYLEDSPSDALLEFRGDRIWLALVGWGAIILGIAALALRGRREEPPDFPQAMGRAA